MSIETNLIPKRKKKVLIHTNAPWVKTGLAENGKELARYLYATNKYEIVYYCSQTSAVDPNLTMTPWKSYGCVPNDPHIINQLNADPGLARAVSYGSHYIDEVIRNEKPDVYIGSDDIWFEHGYTQKKWWNKLNACLHITVDSLPILDQAYGQAIKTKNYFVWTSFAEKEMKSKGQQFSHVKTLYGCFNTENFAPISFDNKVALRKKFNIDPNALIFFYLSRNQLRKSMPTLIESFAKFKKTYQFSKAKLFIHTSVSERGNGWDLPKLVQYHGMDPADLLVTYVCKTCGQWEVKPYSGEDLDCPFCGAKKSQITANIAHGVPDEEMKYLFGIADASVNAFTSGAQERGMIGALLCGLPTAATNYSCGTDICEQPFVHALNYSNYYEAGTNFIKAATSVDSIVNFMKKIYVMSAKDKEKISSNSREWALKTFAVQTIGPQWEKIIDDLPPVDWENFSFEEEVKDPAFPMPDGSTSDENFVQLLYANVLKMNEQTNGDGFKHWMGQIKNGMSRHQIYEFFIKTAMEENNKARKINFKDMLDENGKKRALFLIKESLGDCLITTQLFESFHQQYPNTDLYVACDPKFSEIFEGNPLIYKLLPYQQFMENEMLIMGAGQKIEDRLFDYFFHPAIGTQRLLNYLTIDKVAFDLKLHKS